MPATCYDCGETGHVAAQCPNRDDLDTRPAWCGICDRRTRLVTIDLATGRVERCKTCHPAPSKPLAQHQRCTSCKALVYPWDSTPCGSHQPVSQPLGHVTVRRANP